MVNPNKVKRISEIQLKKELAKYFYKTRKLMSKKNLDTCLNNDEDRLIFCDKAHRNTEILESIELFNAKNSTEIKEFASLISGFGNGLLLTVKLHSSEDRETK